jgi:hypothetical protein
MIRLVIGQFICYGKQKIFHAVYKQMHWLIWKRHQFRVNTLPRFWEMFLRAVAHQLCQDKHQDIRQKTHYCFIRDSSAWNWRQHHESDRCAAVFIISFVSTVLLSLRHVVDIVSWLLQVLTHAGVRPTLESFPSMSEFSNRYSLHYFHKIQST